MGGISVKAHFEINLVPLTIGITQAFYKRIMAFCFPEKAAASDHQSHTTAMTDYDFARSMDKKNKKARDKAKEVKTKASSFYVESPLNKDDVEEMKVRAQLNKLFVYIKIPEVPICVSYKGEKEKNKILDVENFRLQVSEAKRSSICKYGYNFFEGLPQVILICNTLCTWKHPKVFP